MPKDIAICFLSKSWHKANPRKRLWEDYELHTGGRQTDTKDNDYVAFTNASTGHCLRVILQREIAECDCFDHDLDGYPRGIGEELQVTANTTNLILINPHLLV
ncbi:hypothetical protein AAVH_30774 [Aphelenchoides avenae]|nr:hypothetical protein AAVH_41153 [Aphelenchus avenae]KAH7702080.1 hypothetical protein AAVH_30774 [Aphelenchus avenae]